MLLLAIFCMAAVSSCCKRYGHVLYRLQYGLVAQEAYSFNAFCISRFQVYIELQLLHNFALNIHERPHVVYVTDKWFDFGFNFKSCLCALKLITIINMFYVIAVRDIDR